MLAACAARLADVPDLIWVDLGGGTGVRWPALWPSPRAWRLLAAFRVSDHFINKLTLCYHSDDRLLKCWISVTLCLVFAFVWRGFGAVVL